MAPPSDDHPQAIAREAMIATHLAARGIRSAPVLDAFRRVPRERFVPPPLAADAYADRALPVDCGQTISQPYIVALMSEALALSPGARVLEIGTGSGYQTAILALLAQHVFTIEWHLKLMTSASERLAALGLKNVTYRCGDGSRGWPEHAPFDGIIVTAGAPAVPDVLCDQLRIGARLIVPTGEQQDQRLMCVQRTAEGPQSHELLKCRFVKLLGEHGWRD